MMTVSVAQQSMIYMLLYTATFVYEMQFRCTWLGYVYSVVCILIEYCVIIWFQCKSKRRKRYNCTLGRANILFLVNLLAAHLRVVWGIEAWLKTWIFLKVVALFASPTGCGFLDPYLGNKGRLKCVGDMLAWVGAYFDVDNYKDDAGAWLKALKDRFVNTWKLVVVLGLIVPYTRGIWKTLVCLFSVVSSIVTYYYWSCNQITNAHTFVEAAGTTIGESGTAAVDFMTNVTVTGIGAISNVTVTGIGAISNATASAAVMVRNQQVLTSASIPTVMVTTGAIVAFTSLNTIYQHGLEKKANTANNARARVTVIEDKRGPASAGALLILSTGAILLGLASIYMVPVALTCTDDFC